MKKHCDCNCHEEREKERKEENGLLAQRHHLEHIKGYLGEARDGIKIHSPQFSLLIAVEQMYLIEKRRLNRLLKAKGLQEVKRK